MGDPKEIITLDRRWGKEGVFPNLGEKSESLKQRLRILILIPQLINRKAILTFCEILKRQIILLKILLQVYGILFFVSN